MASAVECLTRGDEARALWPETARRTARLAAAGSRSAAGSAEAILDDDQIRLLVRAIEDLAPRERILVELFFRKGLPAEDVAAILRISIGAVYTQKSRILAKLRETLEKAGSR